MRAAAVLLVSLLACSTSSESKETSTTAAANRSSTELDRGSGSPATPAAESREEAADPEPAVPDDPDWGPEPTAGWHCFTATDKVGLTTSECHRRPEFCAMQIPWNDADHDSGFVKWTKCETASRAACVVGGSHKHSRNVPDPTCALDMKTCEGLLKLYGGRCEWRE